MKFQIAKETIERAMQKIDAIVPSRDTQTILSNVLLSTDKDQLSITASDMESTVRITLPIKNGEDGETIVRAKALSDIARKIKSEEIVFEKKEEQASLETEQSNPDQVMYKVEISGDSPMSARYEITGGDKQHFPVISHIDENNLSPLPQAVLEEMISKTFYSISLEDNRYIYNGLCLISENDQLVMVGTDGRRLSAISRPTQAPLSIESQSEADVVIHWKAVSELQKILDYSTDVQVGVEQRNIFFRVGNAELSSRLLEGKFPDYKKVIPADFNVHFEIARSTLLEALSQVSIMAEPPSYQVRFRMASGEVALVAQTPEKGNAEVLLPLDYTFTPLTIGFNANYLTEIIRNLSCDSVKLEFTDPSKPIVVRDTEDKDFIALVMPMNIGNS